MAIKQEDVILGFTGAIGSGCTYISEYLCKNRSFQLICLSDFVKQEARTHSISTPTRAQLQDIGNQLRLKEGNDVLVRRAHDKTRKEKLKGPFIIDSIRNPGEVEALRKYLNFYLIAVDAPAEIREQREIKKKGRKYKDFPEDDRRDQEEDLSYGQQVKQCVYLSDIIIQNSKNFHPNSKSEREFFENFDLYLQLIKNPGNGFPRLDETIMTLAYSQSLRSTCLKRKVGAVIATGDGDIISIGYNEVPPEQESCKDLYGQCYRDYVKEQSVKEFRMCPNCGKKLETKYKCPRCGEFYTEYKVLCSKCGVEMNPNVMCSCGHNILKIFGKMLDQCRALHAEETAIINLSKIGTGISLKDTVIYTTTYPCNLCANKIINAGIKNVIYAEPYPDEQVEIAFKNSNVTTEMFYGVKSRAYFRLYGG